MANKQGVGGGTILILILVGLWVLKSREAKAVIEEPAEVKPPEAKAVIEEPAEVKPPEVEPIEAPIDRDPSMEALRLALPGKQPPSYEASPEYQRMIVECVQGESGNAIGAVTGLGGTIETSYRDMLQVLIPGTSIPELRLSSGVKRVREPMIAIFD